MTCEHCDPHLIKPGRLIRADKTPHGYVCTFCKEPLMRSEYYDRKQARWDKYFHGICVAIAAKSPCLSRQIGAMLVRNRRIISTGFNGPAVGYPHCEGPTCPRRLKGYKSGEGLHECPAAHAEANCIATAAMNGVSVLGTTLYMNCIIPCKDCAIILVNAGVKEIVVDDITPYHDMSIKILDIGKIGVRRFRHEHECTVRQDDELQDQVQD